MGLIVTAGASCTLLNFHCQGASHTADSKLSVGAAEQADTDTDINHLRLEAVYALLHNDQVSKHLVKTHLGETNLAVLRVQMHLNSARTVQHCAAACEEQVLCWQISHCSSVHPAFMEYCQRNLQGNYHPGWVADGFEAVRQVCCHNINWTNFEVILVHGLSVCFPVYLSQKAF